MKQFINSSARLKSDPSYYRKIVDRLTIKRNDMIEAVEAKEAADGKEDKGGRTAFERVSAKIHWAMRMLPSAQVLKRESLNPTENLP